MNLSAPHRREAAPTSIPLEHFFAAPARSGFHISPGGERVAFLSPWKERLNVHVLDLASGAVVRVSAALAGDVGAYAWADDDRLVYLMDTGGDEQFRLFAADADGGRPLSFGSFDGASVDLLDELDGFGTEALIAVGLRDPAAPDVYRIDARTGHAELVAENPGGVTRWLTDHEGNVRAAVTNEGLKSRLLYRRARGDEFEELCEVDFRDTLVPLLFTFDNRHLIVASDRGRERQAIAVFDVDARVERTALYAHPEVDVSEILYSRRRRRLTGVRYVTDRIRYFFFDRARRELQRRLERRLPGLEVTVLGMSRDERRMLVATAADRQPGVAYLHDTRTGALRLLGEECPRLDPALLSEVHAISYPSRDGLPLRGYLTLPRRATMAAGGRPPLVVRVHGGPWARDQWGFDAELQLLANRGYAVLQVNFRGSTGYGKTFCHAGFKQWGGAMLDDIEDGVRWLVQGGVVDPARIAIYGASYGGFAALACLARSPDLYVCGAALSAVSNLVAWLDSFPRHWAPFAELMVEAVGHPVRDRALLESISPCFNAARIRAPVLLAHGDGDARVGPEQTGAMAAALSRAGRSVRTLALAGEGHDLLGESSVLVFYRALERFLCEHLGALGSAA